MRKLFCWIAAASVAALCGFWNSPPAGAAVSDAMIQKITAALPDKAQITPAQPRKLLVFTLANGYVHSSIPVGAAAIQMMGQKTGAYTATISSDISQFEPDNIKQYDAVCMVSTTGDIFMPKLPKDAPQADRDAAQKSADMLEKSLLDFVRSGKGWMGIHAATDSCYNRKEYGDMIGGYFREHPWHEKVGVRVEAPFDALTAAFPEHSFDIVDEIYMFRDQPYSRDKQRVLLSLDMSRTAPKGKRADNDYAVSWVKTYGQGRVFYCSLGHREEIYWNPNILKHYLDGLQFVLGDLQASTTPHPKPADPQPVETTATPAPAK